MTAEVPATLRYGDDDYRSLESSSMLDRWHLGQIAMSNNEMRSRTISNRDGETKVTISVASDSRFTSSILVSRRRTLLRSLMMWRWWRLRKLHERSPLSVTWLSWARSRTPKHTRFLDFQWYGDDGGSPKLCDSFSGDMAIVAAAVAATVIGDLGLGFY